MMKPPTPPPNRYEHAPKLPEGEQIDVRSLVQGEWIELEIGPGRGGFMMERALAEPRVGLVGFEVKRKWATIVDARLKKAGFGSRARVFAEDALFAMPRLVPDGSVRVVYLHFPDPWWKKRHQKRLVMGDKFLEEVARLLCEGGQLFVQTDVEERAEQYETAIANSGRFTANGDAPDSPRIAENPFGARSPREHRAIGDGLPVYRMLYRKR
ncbi:MAG: tRNA (guanine(46)-N(7))-methyltransferase TrmB [Polyangiaceae bacterium]